MLFRCERWSANVLYTSYLGLMTASTLLVEFISLWRIRTWSAPTLSTAHPLHVALQAPIITNTTNRIIYAQ